MKLETSIFITSLNCWVFTLTSSESIKGIQTFKCVTDCLICEDHNPTKRPEMILFHGYFICLIQITLPALLFFH